jgi:Transglutaminase-like superfamily
MVKTLKRLTITAMVVGIVAYSSTIAWYWTKGLPPLRTTEQLARIAVANVGKVIYQADAVQARKLAEASYVGELPEKIVPFVFESPDAPHLVALRKRFDLESVVAGPGGEYDAQMRLAKWIGTRFEHGVDEVPGGRQVCDPVAVIEAGQKGVRFWCEIAARTMMQAATAVGWPARVITASRDAYTWEHAVAELWSNQFDKWFVVDPDFNVVFEADGVPLSAWELVHQGPALQASNRLVIKRLAPLKQGLEPQDLVQFFAYAHVNERNDWCSRNLPVGSPSGGDLATLWTARRSSSPPLTAIPMAVSGEQFDFALNRIRTQVTKVSRDRYAINLSTHSPVFSHFEQKNGIGSWQQVAGLSSYIESNEATGQVAFRVVTRRGDLGPISRLQSLR